MASEIIVEFPTPLTDKEKKMIYGYKGEVVRCKDCKWRNALRCYHKRSSMDDLVGENDYCSWGERREDETD